MTLAAISEPLRFAPPSDELLERLTAIAFAVDARGVVVAWNRSAERWLGISAARALGQPCAKLRVPWTDVTVIGSLLSVLEHGSTVRLDDVKYVRSDGSQGLLGFTASAIAGAAGEPFALVLGRDITDHRLRERKAQEAQKLEAVSQLAAGMAHEINTPAQFVSDNLSFLSDAFRGLMPLLEFLQRQAQAPRTAEAGLQHELARLAAEVDAEFLVAELPRALEQAVQGMQRVANIVASMRCLALPEHREARAVDLNRAISDVLTLSSSDWRDLASLTLQTDPELPPVVCHLSELSQALLNVITNASYAIKQRSGRGPGKLVVRTLRDGDDVLISVEDDGCGIPDSIRDRIFDPFFTTKPVGTGTGQGLSFVRSVVVDRHLGAIDVTSAVGTGTTFTFRIPINGSESA